MSVLLVVREFNLVYYYKTFAALHTWVIEGDLSSIDNECDSIKSSAIAAMETLYADLHSILYQWENVPTNATSTRLMPTYKQRLHVSGGLSRGLRHGSRLFSE